MVNLLILPFSDGTNYVFSIFLESECTFLGVSKINTTKLSIGKKKVWLVEKMDLMQKVENFKIEEKQINLNSITFTLQGSTNIVFEFIIKKPECKIIKRIRLNNKIYVFDNIYIEYGNVLNSPVLKTMSIVQNGKYKNLLLYPWALQGRISSYELSIAGALNVHSNIRLNDQNSFASNNPTIEPIPAFLFRYGPFFLNKDGLGSLVYSTNEFSILAMGILEGEPYKAKGLRDRKKRPFLGMILKYNFIELVYYNTFFNSNEYNLKINFAPEFYLRFDWKLSPKFIVQYWNEKYVDDYFGVSSKEASSSMFNYYRGRPTINYSTKLEVTHYFGKWTLAFNLGIKHFGKEVYNSPTVVLKNEWSFTSAVIYKLF